MPHLLIERADAEGSKRIVTYDRISVVSDDGEILDISPMVRGYNLSARIGAIEDVTLYVLGVRVVENPDLLPKPEAEGVAA